MADFKEVYSYGGFKLYEYAAWNVPDNHSLEGRIFQFDKKPYAVIKTITQKTYHEGGHKLTDMGSTSTVTKLLMTDYYLHITDAKKKLTEKNDKNWYDIKTFLQKNKTIKVGLSFDEKDAFKSTFPGRVKFESASKSWFLTPRIEDLGNLSIIRYSENSFHFLFPRKRSLEEFILRKEEIEGTDIMLLNSFFNTF
jgi:hypothetical protein|tara:strand:+ start:607 stop:1191 length:585 start_codon:yes stop_codon:yes gene_type:complete